MKRVIYILLAIIIVLGGGGALLAKPADASEPGDTLYPLDKAFESIERVLIMDPIKEAEFELDVLEERTAELDSLAGEEGVAEEVLGVAAEAIDAQSDRVQERVQDLENHEGLEEGAMEQVQNRYEKQVQEHTETMNQVKTVVKNMGEGTQLKIETAVDNMEKGLNESKGNSSSGTGSSGSGNTSSGGNGNN